MKPYIITGMLFIANVSFSIAQSRGGADKPSPAPQPKSPVVNNVPVVPKPDFKYNYAEPFSDEDTHVKQSI